MVLFRHFSLARMERGAALSGLVAVAPTLARVPAGVEVSLAWHAASSTDLGWLVLLGGRSVAAAATLAATGLGLRDWRCEGGGPEGRLHGVVRLVMGQLAR